MAVEKLKGRRIKGRRIVAFLCKILSIENPI